MNPKKINHIGIAVSNLTLAIKTYEMLGLKVEKIEEVASMNVRVAFLNIGDTQIELLEPLSADSVIAKFIEKKGEGVHHICFEVEKIDHALTDLKQKNVNLIYDTPQKGAHETLVSFIHPKSTCGVLIELCQKQK